MSKLMVGSSVLREWIESTDGSKESTDLSIMINNLKSCIFDIVKIQATLGYQDERTEILQRVNEILVVHEEELEKLLDEVEDQIIPLARKGGEA